MEQILLSLTEESLKYLKESGCNVPLIKNLLSKLLPSRFLY